MRILILLLVLWSQSSYSQIDEERAHAEKVRELIKPFYSKGPHRYINLRPSDFQINDTLYDEVLANQFNEYINKWTDSPNDPLDLDHLKKPEEYNKLWEQFKEDRKQEALKSESFNVNIPGDCDKEFPRSSYTRHHRYLLDTELESDLIRAYKNFSTLDKSKVYSTNICIEYFNPELINHFLETLKSHKLPIQVTNDTIPKKEFSTKSVVNEKDFKSKTEKYLFFYYLQAKRTNVDFEKDFKTYQESLNKFKNDFDELNRNLDIIINRRKNYYEQLAQLKDLQRYMFLLAFNKDKAVDSMEDFIKNQRASSSEDFYEKLFFACSIIHCPLNFSSPVKSKITRENFSQFGISIKEINSISEPKEIPNKLTSIDPNVVFSFVAKMNKDYLSVQNIKDQSSKNHRIGYLERKITNGSEMFDGPIILIFDKPDWNGKIIEVAHSFNFDESTFPEIKNSPYFRAFKVDKYSESIAGVLVSGKNGEWFNAGTKRSPKWVHISQTGGFFKGTENVVVGSSQVDVYTKNFYDNFKGKKIPYEKIKNNIMGPQAKVLEQKWAEDTLWIKVQYGFVDEVEEERLYQEIEFQKNLKEENPQDESIKIPSPPSRPKIEENKLPILWLPVGNEDGTENVGLGYSPGC